MNNEITTVTQSAVQLAACDNTTSLADVRADKVRYPRISDTEHNLAVKVMKRIVIAAYMYRGTKADEDMAQFTAENLLAELLDPSNGLGTQYLSWFEISRAVKKGVLGQGKEMFGISVASLYEVIADYCRNEGHEAQKEIERRLAPRIPESVQIMMDTRAAQLATVIAQRSR